nr:unnamed protein product [Callosobruchus chinensis]
MEKKWIVASYEDSNSNIVGKYSTVDYATVFFQKRRRHTFHSPGAHSNVREREELERDCNDKVYMNIEGESESRSKLNK